MPWVAVAGSTTTWSSHETTFSETYDAETSAAQTFSSPSAPSPCRDGAAALLPIVQADGSVDFAFAVSVDGDWCVGLTTPVAIVSALTIP